MKKDVTFNIDSDVYEKYCLALSLTREEKNDAIETYMRTYIAKSFERVSQEYYPKTSKTISREDFFGKAEQRIPIWALKPDQYNHKIIRAYFTAVDMAGEATITIMEQLCSDKNNNPELYVPTFKNNYSQMKIDGSKSHGKVFEDNGEKVWIWSEIENTLMKYKSRFYNELGKK